MEQNMRLDYDIAEIECILEKKEAPGFIFSNPNRKWDGIVHFTSGSAKLSIEGVGDFHLNKGDTAVFLKGDKYTFYSEKGCSYITSGYFFTESSKSIISALPKVIKGNPALHDRIVRIESTWQDQRPEGYMICKIELLSLYLEFIRYKRISEKTPYGDLIERAINFIHSNYKRNFSSREIAEHCSLSSSYLRSSFKEKVGVTILEYRDRLRLASAKELLASEELTVKETALVLGFCDVYYFSKFFKTMSGMTPAAYIKSLTANER